MSKFWIFVSLFQVLYASDAEDFNPFDHIIQKPKTVKTVDEDSAGFDENKQTNEQNKVFDNERCVCTCPDFDIPNVAKSTRKVYIGHADNAKGRNSRIRNLLSIFRDYMRDQNCFCNVIQYV